MTMSVPEPEGRLPCDATLNYAEIKCFTLQTERVLVDVTRVSVQLEYRRLKVSNRIAGLKRESKSWP